MKVTFEPGYYEWHLKVNDEIVHTFGDPVDLFTDDYDEPLEIINEEACCDVADLLMFGYRKELEMNGKEIDDELFVLATETIANALYQQYGED